MERKCEEPPFMRERGVHFVDTSYSESQQRENMKRKGPTIEKVMRERKLYEASLSGSVNSLNELIKEDELILDRVCVTCFGETPLHIAAMRGHLEFVIQLVRHMPDLVTQCDSQGFSPLHLASSNGRVEIVKNLLMVNTDVCLFRDEDGTTPLHLAVMKGRIEVVNELVRARPEVIHYKLSQGETLLHCCIKHNRLETLKLLVELARVDDLINVEDHDGITIFHMATALKQMETIKYLLNRTGVKVNAVSGNGFTALDIIEQMPRDLKVMEIRESLLNAGVLRAKNLPAAASSSHQTNQVAAAAVSHVAVAAQPRPLSRGECIKRELKKHEGWLEKKRDALLVAATVIAAMAFQAGLNPPGGVWQDDGEDRDRVPHNAGESVMAYKYGGYPMFWKSNTVSFVASLSIILLLVSGIPMNRRIFMWILMASIWVTLSSMAVTYLYSMFATTPRHEDNNILDMMVVSVLVWLGLIGIIFFVHTVQFIIWCIRKVKKSLNKCFSTRATQAMGPFIV